MVWESLHRLVNPVEIVFNQAILVSRWSWGLMKSTSAVLLDRQAPDPLAPQEI